MATKEGVPDALMIPDGIRHGETFVDVVAAIADVAEPILGVDRAAGERAYIRIQCGGWLFITKSVSDTINFPRGHTREGKPRYKWFSGRPGRTTLGYLIPEGETVSP